MFPLKDTVRAREVPLVNWLLIGVNLFVFVIETRLGPQGLQRLVWALGVVPARFLSHPSPREIATIFTSMFLHGGWFHVISNLWALYLFGDNVEDRMGHGRYLLFYLLTGAAASLTHVLFNPASRLPTVGASGAISGVLGAYLVLFPAARVVTLIPVFFLPWFVEIPAIIYLGMWFLSQLFNGLFSLAATGVIGTYGGVAWWAHVGGFTAGLLLVKFFERRRTYRAWYADEYWPW